MIKDTSPSQELEASLKPPAMSSIFESVSGAFKLNRFQLNFEHSSLRVGGDHIKLSSRMPAPGKNIKIIINSSKNSRNVIELGEGS